MASQLLAKYKANTNGQLSVLHRAAVRDRICKEMMSSQAESLQAEATATQLREWAILEQQRQVARRRHTLVLYMTYID